MGCDMPFVSISLATSQITLGREICCSRSFSAENSQAGNVATVLLKRMMSQPLFLRWKNRSSDVRKRCEELVAAKETVLVKAEECIKVLDVVEDKPINTVIAKRAARVDLRERCMEHAVAKDQFDKAERCVKVLDLVEEKLSNNILESKAENSHG
ncbi:phospholipase-like protein [Artemisia annua]|uniref:Phospholipase-like protein n=1 Tax=Artemisia annua TaxID=35608 RepID=A0A2U1K8U2_ARTAN|nr:phospholipase-like protein [Artemisia annua]